MKRHIRLIGAIAAVVCLCLLCLLPLVAQEAVLDSVDLMAFQAFKDSLPIGFIPPADAMRVDLPPQVRDGQEIAAPDGAHPGNWSLLAGEAPFDSNWEIITVRADTQDVRRLTYDGAADVRPALNREATRIVFTSDRTGNREIFTMNSDGSGLQQLTHHGAEDDFASWLPNSDQIVFASRRDGNWGIYIMNADGSDQRVFYYDPAADNLYPTISPDGSKIAWVKRQGRSGQVWVQFFVDASAFGFGRTCDYMQNLKWITDDDLIFDCDRDEDVMNEMATLTISNGAMETVNDISTQSQLAELWAGGAFALPQGDPYGYDLYRAEIHVHYAIVNQTVYIQDLWSTPRGLGIYPEPSLPLALLRSWQKTDWTPPILSMVGVRPVFYGYFYEDNPSTRQIPLMVEALENGSGVRNYRVEYRTNGGGWMAAYVTGDNAVGKWESAQISAQLGDHIELRIAGRDYAGNSEDATQKAPVSTRFYRGRLNGRVVDRMGLPINGATYESAQLLTPNGTTDASGAFSSYIVKDDIINLKVSHPAFVAQNVSFSAPELSRQPGWITIYENGERDLFFNLFASSNLLKDGSFEQKTLVDWQSDPITATQLVQGGPGLGAQSLLLGNTRPLFNNLQRDYQSYSYPLEFVDFTYDESGVLHLLQRDEYQRCVGNVCSAKQSIYGTEPGPTPRIPVGSIRARSGQVIVAAMSNEGGSLFVKLFERTNGAWRSEKIASSSTWLFEKPDIQIGADGTIHLAWSETYYSDRTNLYYVERKSGTWSAVQTLLSGELEIGNNFRLHLDANGLPHIFYYLNNSGIYEVERSAQGNWLAPRQLNNISPEFGAFDTMIDTANRLHVVWWKVNGLFYAMRENNVWREQELVIENSANLQQGSPQIAVQPNGQILVFGNGAKFYLRDSAGHWVSPRAKVPGLERWSMTAAQIRVGPSSQVALWTNEGTYLCLYEALNFKIAENVERSSIYGNFVIPRHLANPTLFFYASFESDDSAYVQDDPSANRLVVEIDDGETISRPLEIAIPGTYFQPYAVGLHAWKGKEITITLAVDNRTPDLLAWAKLDLMQIASWDTPWIDSVSTESASPRPSIPIGESKTVIITGGNFMPGATVSFGNAPARRVQVISHQRIEAETPSDLPLGAHDLVVTNPIGLSATVLSALRVGEQRYLPIINR